jgi:two-component system, NtrC family, sensor kinase
MKKLIHLLFFWSMVSAVSAQPINPALADSLKFELKRARDDTSRVLILEKLTRCYTPIDMGIAERYARQGYWLAKKIRYLDGKLLCALALGFILTRTSQHAEGLRLLFEAKTYAELHHKFAEEALANSNISNIYSINKEYEKALEYALKAQAIHKKRHISEVNHLISLNLGIVYRDLGKLDTALMYFRRAYEVSLSHTIPAYITSSSYYWPMRM